jgi:hypothetical protein
MANLKDSGNVVLTQHPHKILTSMDTVTHGITSSEGIDNVQLSTISKRWGESGEIYFTMKKLPLASGKSVYYCSLQNRDDVYSSWVVSKFAFGREQRNFYDAISNAKLVRYWLDPLKEKHDEIVKTIFGKSPRIQLGRTETLSQKNERALPEHFDSKLEDGTPKYSISCYLEDNIKLVERDIVLEEEMISCVEIGRSYQQIMPRKRMTHGLYVSAAAYDTLGEDFIYSRRADINSLETTLHNAAKKIKTGARG